MSALNSLPTRLSWLKSLISALPAPGYWILTATCRPSCQMARCTCPMDAAATGASSNSAKLARQSSPISLARTRCTALAGSGGADSCSLVRVARYGPAISGGRAASKIESAWPNFMAPPLSSPRTRKICSAVRCCISWATSSAGRPPMRLPKPRAVRPARPTGSEASFAVRVKARRGRSFMISILRLPGRVCHLPDHARHYRGHACHNGGPACCCQERLPRSWARLPQVLPGMPATCAVRVRRPGPAAPLPSGEDEFQRSVGHRAGLIRPVSKGQRLGGGLSGHGRGQGGVAGGRIGLPAGQLGQDQRPGRVAIGPGQIQAAQAG